MEILIVLFLILINGILAMAEIAVVSSRKSKLQQQANDGNKNAEAALELANNPNRFLSTVQIGITLVGIFAGAFGGATIAESLSLQLSQVPFLGPYSDALGLGIVVIAITYLSLIIGELVPKRVALNYPETIAAFLARPMVTLSQISSPLVSLLAVSTDFILGALRIKPSDKPSVSEEEVRMLIREGTRTGVFEVAEREIVERTLLLGDKKMNSLMTSRKEVVWLNIDSSYKITREKITKHPHSHYPVCRDSLDKVIGVVRTEDLLTNLLLEERLDLRRYIHKPLFVPESMDVLHALELFKKSGIHLALIVDEYGNVQGLLSLADVFEAIVGDIPAINELADEEIVRRDNGTWLVDGLVPIDEFKERFQIKKLPGEKTGVFHTVGGFVMHKLGRVPVSGDGFEFGEYRYEVIDMDANRVDKVIISPLT